MAENTTEIALLVRDALKDETLGHAFEKARLALGDRERIAVDLLLDGLATSGGEAMRAAGYAPRTASNPGAVLERPRVALVMELGRRLKSKGREVTTESYRDDLVELAHADPAGAFDDDGRIKALSEWPPALRRMVKTIKLGPLGHIESVAFEGRGQVMALLGRHRLVGAFESKQVEKRTYIIRDYTGQQPLERELKAVDQAAPALPSPAQGPAIPAEAVDRGFIPLSGQPDGQPSPDPAHEPG